MLQEELKQSKQSRLNAQTEPLWPQDLLKPNEVVGAGEKI